MLGKMRLIVLGLALTWAACNSVPKSEVDTEPEILEETLDQYGFVTDSFLVVKDKVRRNQNLSSILLPYGVPYATIDQLAKASKEVFDVRKLASGKPYTIYCTKDRHQ